LKGEASLCGEVPRSEAGDSMSHEITMGSLFDGISSFPLAPVHCGVKSVWSSKIETSPMDVTKERFRGPYTKGLWCRLLNPFPVKTSPPVADRADEILPGSNPYQSSYVLRSDNTASSKWNAHRHLRNWVEYSQHTASE